MADIFNDHARTAMLKAYFDVSSTFYAILLMENTTAGTEPEKEDLIAGGGRTNLTTLDEFDGGGYIGDHAGSGRKACVFQFTTNTTDHKTTMNVVNNYIEWTALSNSATGRQIAGCMIIKKGTSNDQDAKFVTYFELPVAIDPNGKDFRFEFPAIADHRNVVAA